jgi:hypothetical protein
MSRDSLLARIGHIEREIANLIPILANEYREIAFTGEGLGNPKDYHKHKEQLEALETDLKNAKELLDKD